MGNRPRIIRLGRCENERGFGSTHYRVSGGEVASGWEPREGREAWCEFSVWDGSDRLGTYGGEVWPTAWPDLFEAVSGAPGSICLTPRGRALLPAPF